VASVELSVASVELEWPVWSVASVGQAVAAAGRSTVGVRDWVWAWLGE